VTQFSCPGECAVFDIDEQLRFEPDCFGLLIFLVNGWMFVFSFSARLRRLFSTLVLNPFSTFPA
jgi:hypothetical protein